MTDKIIIHSYLNTDKAISSEKGDIINREITKHLQIGEKVIVDFSGLKILTTAFLNFAIGKLYTNFNRELIKELVELKSNPSQQSKIDLVIENTTNKINQLDFDEVALNG